MEIVHKSFLIITFLIIGLFVSCTDDNGNTSISEEVFLPEVRVDQEIVIVKIENDVNVNITDGAGSYNAFSLNPDIATVITTNNVLTIKGVNIGKTSIIISDAESRYMELPVIAYLYDKLILSETELDIEFKLGNLPVKPYIVDIIEGNGQYSVESDSEIATAEIYEDGKIAVSIKGEGKGKITITDIKGLQSVISINARTTTEPFTDEELENIKNEEELTFNYESETRYNEWFYGTIFNTIENGKNLYGYNNFGFLVLKVYFSGDKSVGVKTNATLTFKTQLPNIDPVDDQPIKFEIIKNDGTKIWAVYSFVKNNKVHGGYFIQKINP